jgi:phosphatidylinositol alpha-mannosyltransferase
MRIALVSSNSFHYPGGIQNHIMGLYKYLKKRGHYVKIISPKYDSEERLCDDVIFFGKAKKISFNASLSDLSIIGKEYKAEEILKENFDIIHFHNPGLFITTELLEKSNTKNIITFHVLPDASIFYKALKIFLKYLNRIKIVKKINGVIIVSKPLRKYISKYFRCKKRVIPNGIDLDAFNKRDVFDEYMDGKMNLLFLGRIEKRKGLIYLIKAFEILKKSHENIRLIVAGSGDLEKKCKKYVEKNRIKDVVFVGSVSEEDKIKYMNTCDIFCAPSIYGESFGIVLLEAMACGKPIVAFANQGYKQVLTGIQRRFLVKPKDVEGLAKKIETLLLNENVRKELSVYGKKEVKKYSWDLVGKQIEEFYEEVLNEK